MTKFPKGMDGQIRLKQIKVRLIEPEECERWNQLITDHHYLGNANLTGRQLRYVAECRGRCVALISFSASAFKLKGRDEFIGWNDAQRYQRLNFVAQNSRFMILPDVSTKNLASHVLKLCRKRLMADWADAFDHPLLLIETFVDKAYPGTSYRADNWVRLGETMGFSRDSQGFYIENGSPKALWVKELVKGAASILSCSELPSKYAPYELPPPKKLVSRSFTSNTLENLFDAMRSIKDKRGTKGRRHNLATCLSLVVCGTLAGAKGLSQCAEIAKGLRQPQLRALMVWRKPATGKYTPPSHSALHRILSGVDPLEFEEVFTTWFNNQADSLPAAICIDGKALRANLNDNGDGLHAVSAVSHDGTPFLPRPQSKARGTKVMQHET